MNQSFIDRVREVFGYDQDSGCLVWKKRTGPRVVVGSIAGTLAAVGYLYVRLDGVLHLVHRLVWMHQYGEGAPDQIDHKDGVRTNNRLSNLRAASNALNRQNMKPLFANNKSGFNGVYWHKQTRKWRAEIRLGGKKHYLGGFDDLAVAGAVALEAKNRLHTFNARA